MKKEIKKLLELPNDIVMHIWSFIPSKYKYQSYCESKAFNFEYRLRFYLDHIKLKPPCMRDINLFLKLDGDEKTAIYRQFFKNIEPDRRYNEKDTSKFKINDIMAINVSRGYIAFILIQGILPTRIYGREIKCQVEIYEDSEYSDIVFEYIDFNNLTFIKNRRITIKRGLICGKVKKNLTNRCYIKLVNHE